MLTFCAGDKQVITCETAIVRCIGTHMVHVTGRLPVGILDRTGDITLQFPIEKWPIPFLPETNDPRKDLSPTVVTPASKSSNLTTFR